jgi:hypothetical protein
MVSSLSGRVAAIEKGGFRRPFSLYSQYINLVSFTAPGFEKSYFDLNE